MTIRCPPVKSVERDLTSRLRRRSLGPYNAAMDRNEEGLRAFALKVGAYAGASYPERPLWVERDGVRIAVEAVESQWVEEERAGFRVRLADGSRLLLYYVPELELWSGVPFVASPSADPARRSEEWT